MKVTGTMKVETVTDVLCDVCGCSTRVTPGGLQFATLKAHWGYGTTHDGERYELHLCEGCFFGAVAFLKQERRVQRMFDDARHSEVPDGRFGVVATDDFFGDES